MKEESLLQRWKVGFSFVAGVLVVSTMWGTCSFRPEFPAEETPPVEELGTQTVEPETVPTSLTTESATTTQTTTTQEAATTTQTPTETATSTETATTEATVR
jgi:cytoskeletal protein RodZ